MQQIPLGRVRTILTRRSFLRQALSLTGVAGASLVLSACGQAGSATVARPTAPATAAPI